MTNISKAFINQHCQIRKRRHGLRAQPVGKAGVRWSGTGISAALKNKERGHARPTLLAAPPAGFSAGCK
ncbi:MAG: hypothetical protein KME26_31480 [Oscillatoria princeps RMCB-10]|nr:hypothetical protein [Oscillatoria princeps RMCB-10]